MGKSKKKSDEKKAALQARKDAKADKAAKKRLQKEARLKDQEPSQVKNDDENLDELLEQYRKKDAEVSTTVLEALDGDPLPRANFSLTCCDDKNGHLYMFGGEYYDGIENIIVDDLLRWEPQKEEWRKVITPLPKPSPRCAHSCVYYSGALYVLGGEFATSDQYHHYKDIWKFDLKSLKWEEIQPRSTGTPFTARSGHSAFLWKHYMVIFGGFYEALRETRWYNDVCVLDLQTNTWLDIPHSKLGSRPEERSACCAALFGDTAIIHGGYSKLRNPTTKGESKVHNDTWILHLRPMLQGKPPTWERLFIRGKGSAPKNRSGMVSATYKNRMMVFGGVTDEEEQHHKVSSVFYNELMAFEMERRKWFPVRVKYQSSDSRSRRRRKTSDYDPVVAPVDTNLVVAPVVSSDNDEKAEVSEGDNEEEDDEDHEFDGSCSGWNLATLRSNMFAFIDGDGNIVYERIEDEGITDKEAFNGEEEKGEEQVNTEKEDTKVDKEKEDVAKSGGQFPVCPSGTTLNSHSRPTATVEAQSPIITSSAVMKVDEETGNPEAVARAEPLPRMNAGIVIRGNILYVYGGLLEVGDREVTLDDFWLFDLKKRDQWICLREGTMHRQVWRGAVHDDDDSYVSTGTGDADGGEDSDLEIDPLAATEVSEQEAGNGTSRRKGVREEIAKLRQELELDERERTPQMGESLSDFYTRTSTYWTTEAASTQTSENDALDAKEMKREGFALAQKRFNELEPILKRLDELEEQQVEAEESKKSHKQKKKKKKKEKDEKARKK